MERYIVVSRACSCARRDNVPASLDTVEGVCTALSAFNLALASRRRFSRSAISSSRDC
jgi:hypothetical protein